MNCYSPVNALIDSRATYNFISHAVIELMRLKACKGNAPTTICTNAGTYIPMHGVYRQMLQLRNASGADWRLVANLRAADITGYDIILGIPWLTRQNPDVDEDQNHRFWGTPRHSEDGLLRL